MVRQASVTDASGNTLDMDELFGTQQEDSSEGEQSSGEAESRSWVSPARRDPAAINEHACSERTWAVLGS